jgi:6-pyruvoyltetrahydropterin/6-carboxytetrahydropterin synthase
MPRINCTILHGAKKKMKRFFGDCANENWHGHNFNLYVTVKGNPDKDSGFVMDAKHLSRLIKEHVTEKTRS